MPFHYTTLTISEIIENPHNFAKRMTIIVLYEPQNQRFYAYGDRYPTCPTNKNMYDFLCTDHDEQVGALATLIYTLMNTGNPTSILLHDVAIEQSDFDNDSIDNNSIDFQFFYEQIRDKNSLIQQEFDNPCKCHIKTYLKMLITEKKSPNVWSPIV
jgi:hypothetical protein